MTEMMGTPFYVAPEVINGQYNSKCDIWSIGIITYILMCGKAPFYGNNNEEILKMVKDGNLTFESNQWSMVSPEAIDFIKSLL